MSQPRGRGPRGGEGVAATRGQTHGRSPAAPAEGRWAGDVRAFVDWCEGASDLEAYRDALATVPPHDMWKTVSRTLHAEIEFTPRPLDTGPRATTAEVFRTLDPAGADLRAAKRRILEAEITRRATA